MSSERSNRSTSFTLGLDTWAVLLALALALAVRLDAFKKIPW